MADLYLRRGVTRVEASAFMALTPAVVRYAATGLSTDPAGTDPAEEPPLREDLARRGGEPLPGAAPGRDPASARGAGSADRRGGAARRRAAARRGRHRRGRLRRAHRQPAADRAPAGDPAPARPRRRRARLSAGGPRRRGRRPGHALGGRRGVRARRRLRAHRLGQPGLRRVRPPRERHGAARRGGNRRRDHGAGGRHVRARRQGAGAARGARCSPSARRSSTSSTGPTPSLESIPADEREKVETQLLRASFGEAWASTRAFWAARDPREVAKAEPTRSTGWRSSSARTSASRAGGRSPASRDAAPTSRSGAGRRWARSTRGPAAASSRSPRQRTVVQIARNLLEGAAVVTRAQQLRASGLAVPAAAFDFRPRPLA